MSAAKITVSVEQSLLRQVDELVSDRIFNSRSQVFQVALEESLEKFKRNRLAEQCALLDPIEEMNYAEIGIARETDEWPQY